MAEPIKRRIVNRIMGVKVAVGLCMLVLDAMEAPDGDESYFRHALVASYLDNTSPGDLKLGIVALAGALCKRLTRADLGYAGWCAAREHTNHGPFGEMEWMQTEVL